MRIAHDERPIGVRTNFYVVVGLLVVWAMAFAASTPVRQAYLSSLIPSEQRATVLSFDSMVNSLGGVTFQPVLGRVADTLGDAASNGDRENGPRARSSLRQLRDGIRSLEN